MKRFAFPCASQRLWTQRGSKTERSIGAVTTLSILSLKKSITLRHLSLRSSSGPIAHAEKGRAGFGVGLHPGEPVGDIAKAPGIDNAHGVGQVRHGRPQEKKRVSMSDFPHRQGTDGLRLHQRIGVCFGCGRKSTAGIIPGRIGIDDLIFFQVCSPLKLSFGFQRTLKIYTGVPMSPWEQDAKRAGLCVHVQQCGQP